jgi:alpha-tubulin suppressor-like RCC1 family protein
MYGKLGHGNEAGCSAPKRVDGLNGLTVVQIACGSRHTVIVTSTGATHSWGDMENGAYKSILLACRNSFAMFHANRAGD